MRLIYVYFFNPLHKIRVAKSYGFLFIHFFAFIAQNILCSL